MHKLILTDSISICKNWRGNTVCVISFITYRFYFAFPNLGNYPMKKVFFAVRIVNDCINCFPIDVHVILYISSEVLITLTVALSRDINSCIWSVAHMGLYFWLCSWNTKKHTIIYSDSNTLTSVYVNWWILILFMSTIPSKYAKESILET